MFIVYAPKGRGGRGGGGTKQRKKGAAGAARTARSAPLFIFAVKARTLGTSPERNTCSDRIQPRTWSSLGTNGAGGARVRRGCTCAIERDRHSERGQEIRTQVGEQKHKKKNGGKRSI